MRYGDRWISLTPDARFTARPVRDNQVEERQPRSLEQAVANLTKLQNPSRIEAR